MVFPAWRSWMAFMGQKKYTLSLFREVESSVGPATVKRLSLLKIISANSNDAVLREPAQQRSLPVAGLIDRAEHPCPTTHAFASHCNSGNTRLESMPCRSRALG